MISTRPSTFLLCVTATGCWWSYAFLESLLLHAPLRIVGFVLFVLACVQPSRHRRAGVADSLDEKALVVAPFLAFNALLSFLAYAGPLALPPEPIEPARSMLVAKLSTALFVGLAAGLMMVWRALRWALGATRRRSDRRPLDAPAEPRGRCVPHRPLR